MCIRDRHLGPRAGQDGLDPGVAQPTGAPECPHGDMRGGELGQAGSRGFGVHVARLSSCSIALIPVSYTHLDVYKRQLLVRAVAAARRNSQAIRPQCRRPIIPGAHATRSDSSHR